MPWQCQIMYLILIQEQFKKKKQTSIFLSAFFCTKICFFCILKVKNGSFFCQPIIDGRGNRSQACRRGRLATSSQAPNSLSCSSEMIVMSVYGDGRSTVHSASQTFVCFARTTCSTLRLRRRLPAAKAAWYTRAMLTVSYRFFYKFEIIKRE